MLIRGMNTEKVTDGVEFVLPHPFAISGTYKYKAVSGTTKTVFVLNTAEVNERMKEAQAEVEKKRVAAEKVRAAAEEALYTKWTVGEEEVVAKYGGYVKGLVTLVRKDDGTTVEVPISSLGKSDQDWVRQGLKRVAAEKAAKEKAAKAEKAKRSRGQ